MAAYFSGSNIQTEAMQTLYLMNPDYTGYADMGNPGSMLFLNHSLGNQSSNQNLPTGGHLQNPYTGIQFPSAAPPKHSSADSLERPGTSQQGVGSSLLATRLGSQGYNTWRNIGNELTFMQGADPNRHTQSLSEKIRGYSSVENHPISEIDPTDIKHTTISNPQLSINQSNIGLQLDQSQASEAHMQGLSLSLSPQQLSSMQLSCFQNQPTRSHLVHTNANGPSISEANSHENTNMLDRINNKLSGTQSSFLSRDSTPCPNILMTASSAGADRQLQSFSNAYLSTGVPNSLTGSKYFKATQELLDEIVSVGRGTKYDSGKNQKGEKKNLTTDGTANEGPMSASTCVQEIKSENPAALSPADRQELQMKKAKLVAMLDEVDRRYRQYYHQMQIVVSSFEAAAGLGSAKTYTALALKTISRHFRSLRDAIAGQIRLTSKNLGEDEFTGSGQGGTSRLHFVDQQLRQQRALQQLGMLQQHAWRPQRGLPERAVSILRAWLFEHFLHPYPKDADKHFLARQTGLTRNQVSNWFINARVRLWKPMVEEMYMEEVKEAESQASGADSKATAESDQNKAEPEAKDQGNTDNGEEDKAPKITAMKEDSNAGYSLQPETSNMTLNAGLSSANRISGGNHSLGIASLSENNNFFHSPIEEETDLRQEGQQKRVRNLIHDSTAIMPNLMTNDVGLRTEENDYSFSNNKILQMDENGDFGSYQVQGLSRFGQDQFSGLGGVSLTLGLQHCDHLSMSRAQRPYAGEMPLSSERRSDLGVGIEQSHFQQIQNGNDVDSANDYNTLGMHNQKRYPSQLLHDFVA